MLTRIWSIATKEFLHLIHDWWLPAFMLFGGVLELLLVGWATSRPITNLPLMVLDQDHSQSSRAFLTAIENTGTFNILEPASELADIQEALDKGNINAAVIISAGFSKEMAVTYGTPEVAVILNGAESLPATTARRAIEGVARDLDEKITLKRLNLDAEQLAVFEPSLRIWFNQSLSEAYYTTPAELGLMLEFTVLLFAALTFSREKELGTLEQLLVMPFSSIEIIVGKAIPVICIGFVDFALMLAMVHFAFGVPVEGSLVLLFVLVFGYILVELSKGLVISVFSRSQHQAFLLVMVVGMADFMFTGYAAPVDSMPEILQAVANFVPAYHWLVILRGILLKGVGLELLWVHILAILGLGLFIGTFSLRYVRRTLS